MENNITFLAIGTDPEAFLYDMDGKPISSVGLIGGSKAFPKFFDEDGYAVQEDNVTVEFNVPPSRSEDEFVAVINKAKTLVSGVLPKGLKMVFNPSEMFTDEQLDNEQAQEFGCSPDFNAWKREMNPRPDAHTNLRSAGGHIHVSYDPENMDTTLELIKYMDLYLSVPAVLLDIDTRRKQLYGKAGAFRFTSWGLEYRSLSNFWLQTDESIKMVFRQTQRAIEAYNQVGHSYFLDNQRLSDEVIECINTNNADMANSLIKRLAII